MAKIRRCDDRCHSAKGTKCRCWCGGAFHGKAGTANRAAAREKATGTLEAHGFKKGETAYIEQTHLPIPENTAREGNMKRDVKSFSCHKCGCKRFWRRRSSELLIDFGREGAVEGHPALEGPEKTYTPPYFVCAECGVAAPMEMCKEMEAEIV